MAAPSSIDSSQPSAAPAPAPVRRTTGDPQTLKDWEAYLSYVEQQNQLRFRQTRALIDRTKELTAESPPAHQAPDTALSANAQVVRIQQLLLDH